MNCLKPWQRDSDVYYHLDFIAAAVETATEFEGVYDLMKLWISESDAKEREEIVADIQDMIHDCEQQDHKEAPSIRFV